MENLHDYPGINRMYSDKFGEDVKVQNIAIDSTNGNKVVVYQSIHLGTFFTTPLKEFNENFMSTYPRTIFRWPKI